MRSTTTVRLTLESESKKRHLSEKKEKRKVWSLGLAEICSKVQYFWWIWEEYSSNTVQDLKMYFKKTVIFFKADSSQYLWGPVLMLSAQCVYV